MWNKSHITPALLLLFACASSKPIGRLYDADGELVANQSVRLVEISHTGAMIREVESFTTNDRGEFVPSDLGFKSNASMIYVASVGDREVSAFSSGNGSQIEISLVSTKIVEVILDMTELNAVKLSDFNNEELRNIHASALALAELKPNVDETNLDTTVRTKLGRAIAQAAGGEITASAPSSVEPPNAVSTQTFAANSGICPTGTPIALVDLVDSFRLDLFQNGALCGSSSEIQEALLLPNSMELQLPENVFFAYGGDYFPNTGSGSISVEDSREYVFGPYALRKPLQNEGDTPEEDAVTVTRKIYVPSSGSFARYAETITNAGSSAKTLDLKVRSFLTTDVASQVLTETSGRFVAVYDSSNSKPTVTFVYGDGTAAPSVVAAPSNTNGLSNEVSFLWSGLSVPAGETKILLHYVFFSSSRDASVIQSSAQAILESPEMEGLSLAELRGVHNFRKVRGTITGAAGSVVGRVNVQAKNSRTSATNETTSGKDGSFGIPLDVTSGDQITVTAGDGLDKTFTIP